MTTVKETTPGVALAERMNRVSAKINQIEDEMADIWFDFSYAGLFWERSPHGRYRIFKGDKPLAEHKFDVRLESIADLIEMKRLAFEEADKRLGELDGLGNR